LPASASLAFEMNAWRQIAAATLGALLAAPAAAGFERPRPSEVPSAETTLAPNGFQLYNDFASPERMYSSQRVVVHYVVVGIDAPPLNDDDADGVPDYVARVGEAADQALAYFERRGFRCPLPDEGGPDARPDVYVSRFAPGTLGVSFPAAGAQGGAFAVVANNLDPSAERSFASVYATVAHELFHLTQFAYFGPKGDPAIPTWILEGTAAAIESRVYPDLDDLVSTIQLRRWFSATAESMTTQSYGAQLLWRRLDVEQPRFLPALLTRVAEQPGAGEAESLVASTYARVAHEPFAAAFNRFAISVADRVEPAAGSRRGVLAPLSVRYLRVSASRTRMRVTFSRGRGGAAGTLVYLLDGEQGRPVRTLAVAPLVRNDGRRLGFTVAMKPGTTAMLVLANGGVHAVRYAVSAR
jgi:hypothetical protein